MTLIKSHRKYLVPGFYTWIYFRRQQQSRMDVTDPFDEGMVEVMIGQLVKRGDWKGSSCSLLFGV